MDIYKLALGLIILIVVNIVLGSIDAWLTKTFDKEKFKKGILKGFIISLCFIATYFVGYLNPNVIVINMNSVDVDLLSAVTMVITAGYIWYGKEVITKLIVLVKGKITIEETSK